MSNPGLGITRIQYNGYILSHNATTLIIADLYAMV